jgi:osmotically-inducible protein OsmY
MRRSGWASFALAALLSLAAPAGAASMPDAWITTKAKMALIGAENVSATRINVDTTDGRVTLHGSARSAQERAAAEQAVRKVDGVTEVRNLLQVVPAGTQDIMKVADADLTKRVSAALERDKALADSDISVTSVNAGLVVLGGTAKTLSDHRRALEVAARVDGVDRVESQIESPDQLADAEIWREGGAGGKGTERTDGSAARDMWITSEAKLRLMANPDTPALDINVDTFDGVVTLFGSVPTQQAKQQATNEVRKVGGVSSVKNELQVVPKAKEERVSASDDSVEEAIAKRIGARDELEDADIDVEVSNGVARLKGSVASYSDRLTAITVARGTSGVRAVLDELKLNPPAVSAR